MADRVSATITIGGTITAVIFSGLVEQIVDADLRTEWDGPRFDLSVPLDGQPLALFAHEVAGGMFEALEEYCVQEAIAFARWSGSAPGAFAAERVVYPGAGEPRSYTADDEDHILISRDTVEALGNYEAVLSYFDEAEFTIPPLIVTG